MPRAMSPQYASTNLGHDRSCGPGSYIGGSGMVRDTTPRRFRLTTFTTAIPIALISACATSAPPRKGERELPLAKHPGPSLGRFTVAPTGYPEEYPVYFLGPDMQFDVGALIDTRADAAE